MRHDEDEEQDEEKRPDIYDNPDCTWNDDGSVTLQLHYPFEWGKHETISELRIRRPKLKDMKVAKNSGDDGGGRILARLCGRKEAELDDLDIYDLTVASDIIEDFTKRSRANAGTGDNGSER